MNEIITGLINTHNYITTMTVGCLKDLYFTINNNSQYIKNTGINMSFV